MFKRCLAAAVLLGCTMTAVAAPQVVGDARYKKLRKTGEQALARKDYATAEKSFERLVYLYPSDVEAYNALGYAYYLDGRYETALLSFKQALQLVPNHPAALNNLMLAVGKRATEESENLEFSEAIGLLSATERLYPGHPQAVVLHYFQGQLEFYRGNEAAGLRDWQQVAAKAPTSGTAKFVEAYKLYKSGKLKEAAVAMKAAQKRLPKEPVVRNYLALILSDLGQYPEAISQLQKAQAGNPPYIDLYTNLADVYLRSGQNDLALAELKKGRDLRPDFASIHARLASLQRATGDNDGAAKELGLAVASGGEGVVLIQGEAGRSSFVDGNYVGVSPTGAAVTKGRHKVKVMAKGKPTLTGDSEAAELAVATVGETLAMSTESMPAGDKRAARSFALRDQSNKYWRSFQHFHHRPVVLLFWRVGAAGNDDTLRALSELGSRFGTNIGCAVIHTDLKEKNQALSQMISLPASYARLFDDGNVMRKYGIEASALPTVVVVDLDGYIASQGQGAAGVTAAREALDKMVGGAAAPAPTP